jgi:hypothetical protein
LAVEELTQFRPFRSIWRGQRYVISLCVVAFLISFVKRRMNLEIVKCDGIDHYLCIKVCRTGGRTRRTYVLGFRKLDFRSVSGTLCSFLAPHSRSRHCTTAVYEIHERVFHFSKTGSSKIVESLRKSIWFVLFRAHFRSLVETHLSFVWSHNFKNGGTNTKK